MNIKNSIFLIDIYLKFYILLENLIFIQNYESDEDFNF
jgi:hypothetical protein